MLGPSRGERQKPGGIWGTDHESTPGEHRHGKWVPFFFLWGIERVSSVDCQHFDQTSYDHDFTKLSACWLETGWPHSEPSFLQLGKNLGAAGTWSGVPRACPRWITFPDKWASSRRTAKTWSSFFAGTAFQLQSGHSLFCGRQSNGKACLSEHESLQTSNLATCKQLLRFSAVRLWIYGLCRL